jgi:hypothetical protein
MTERDIEAAEEDIAEQLTRTATDDSLEVDSADRAEQQRPVTEQEDDSDETGPESLEVDPADSSEQRRSVALDDDEYR